MFAKTRQGRWQSRWACLEACRNNSSSGTHTSGLASVGGVWVEDFGVLKAMLEEPVWEPMALAALTSWCSGKEEITSEAGARPTPPLHYK